MCPCHSSLRRGRPSAAASGFTLAELLCALAIAALALGLGVPRLQNVLADARRTAAVNALVGHVQLARSESVRRQAPVVLCPAAVGGGCAGAGVDWSGGWMVIVPADPWQPAEPDPNADVLARHSIDLPGGLITANRQSFVFHPERRSTNGTLVICDRRGASHARAVIISYTGRPRTATTAPGGAALSCL